MNKLEGIKYMLCDELDKMASKGELTTGSLQTIDTLTHALKNTMKILKMEKEDGGEYGMNGYNNNYGMMPMDTMHYSSNGMNSNSYNRGMMGGRYNSNRYSYNDAKQNMLKEVREAIAYAQGRDREILERCMNELENM